MRGPTPFEVGPLPRTKRGTPAPGALRAGREFHRHGRAGLWSVPAKIIL